MENCIYSAALVGGPPWGFRVASTDGHDQTDSIYVAQVIPQSRADNERIQAGDVLLTVNSRDVAGLKLHEVQRLLKRSTGIIRLTLRRNPSNKSPIGHRSPQPHVHEIPIKFSSDQSQIPIRTHTESPYRRARRRIVGGSGDFSGVYSNREDDSHADYSYHHHLSRSTVSSDRNTSRKEFGQSQESGNSTEPGRTWAPVQFAPMIMSSAPTSPMPGSKSYYSYRQTTTTTTSRRQQQQPMLANEWDKYLLTPESALAMQRYSSISDDDRSPVPTREEGSSTPKPSSSVTPVMTNIDSHMLASKLSESSDYQQASDQPPSMDAGSRNHENLDVQNQRSIRRIDQFDHPNPAYLPDDMAFYDESTPSEHPSLGTSSLGIDFNDRISSRPDSQQADADADESDTSNYPELSKSPFVPVAPAPVDQRQLEGYHENITEENIEDASKMDSMDAKNANPVQNSAREASIDRILASQPEPHYPLAFEPQNMLPVDLTGSTISESGAAKSYNEYDTSNSLRGPNFKAPHQEPAFWTPNVASESADQSIGGRIYDIPISHSENMPGYAPVPYQMDASVQSNDQQQNTMTDMNIGGNAGVPPPPPPPPPPSASGGGRYLASLKAQRESEEAIANDPNRSVVEYPEKQSVASLRTAIATKFNGTAPIKGSLPSPGQETSQDSFASKSESYSTSALDPPPQFQPFQVSKAVEEATANLMSSVIGGSSISYGQSDQPKPLSVTTHGPARWSATPPARPPLPYDMKSPTPPNVPPAPTGFIMQPSPTMSTSSMASSNFRLGAGRPDNFARPYDRTSIRGTDNISTPQDIDHYAIPYRETTTVTRRRLGRGRGEGNFKYEDIGPMDNSGIPLASRELIAPENQREWYKMMYKKMHQIDRKEDPSVLRYRIRDFTGDRFMDERSPRTRLAGSAGSSPSRAGYKFAEYMAELPADENEEPGAFDFDKSYTPKPFSVIPLSPNRMSRPQERDAYNRSNRSKSANRFEVTQTPPPFSSTYSNNQQQQTASIGEQMRTEINTSGNAYQYQRSAENYAPAPFASTYEQEKRRMESLSNRPQSAVAFGTRYDYQHPPPSTQYHRGGIQEYAAGDTYIHKKRELSPMRRDEAKQWYQNVQSGGEAPFTGFRQPAPERRDSLFRTAWLRAKASAKTGRPSVKFTDSKRDVCVQTTSDEHSITLTSTTVNGQSRTEVMVDSNRYWSSSDHGPIMRRRSGTSPANGQHFSSPVRTLDHGSKLYAWERFKIKDFHLPFFRLSPASRPSSRCSDREIDAYFDYLKSVCDTDRDLVDKCVQTANSDGRSWWHRYDQILRDRRVKEEEFNRTYQILNDALKEIEILASPKLYRREMKKESIRNGFRSIEKSFSAQKTLTSGYSMPAGLECYRKWGQNGYLWTYHRGRSQNKPKLNRSLSLPELPRRLIVVSSGTWPLESANRGQPTEDAEATTDVSIDADSELEELTSISDRLHACEKLDQRDDHHLHSPYSEDRSSRSCNDTSDKESGCMSADLASLEKNPQCVDVNGKSSDSPRMYTSIDVGSNRNRPINDKLDFDIDEFSKLEKELTQEDERRKRQLKELEDQKAKWHHHQLSTTAQYSPSTISSNQQQPRGNEVRAVAKALYNFQAQTNKEVSFRKGDLIKIRRQVDDHWYEGECHGKVGLLPISYVDIAASALGDERTMLTEVSTKSEGMAQALYNFQGKNVNELPLRKGEFVVLTKRVDENWTEGRNAFGRRGIFPTNYVKTANDPALKTTDYVTSFTGSGQSQTFVRGNASEDIPRPLPNGSQYDTARNLGTPIGIRSHIRSTAPPQPISTNIGTRDSDLVTKARELTQTARKEFGSTAGPSGAEALDAALSAGQPDTFQALFPYKPQNPDELELKENDIVYVVEKCDDGWFIGTSLRTGRFGTFPGNYVKRL